MRKAILFVVNELDFFISHRLPVAIAARDAGFDVHVGAPGSGPDSRISSAGLTLHRLSFRRNQKNPIAEAMAVANLASLMRRIKPDVVHLVTARAIVTGSLAARFARVRLKVAAITGLGYAFTSSNILVRNLVSFLLRFSLSGKNTRVIVQNNDDLAQLISLGIVKMEQCSLIPGSGISLQEYAFVPEPEGSPVVVFAARLLRDKGIVEFVEAAQILRDRGVEARFKVVGSPDPNNPTSVSDQQIAQWKEAGVVEFAGRSDNVAKEFQSANIVALPSYREGMPRTLLEASSCGRAIVTTDVPGCREAIVNNETGLLVPARDARALAEALAVLVQDADLRKKMGAAGRKLAEQRYDIRHVVDVHLNIYSEAETIRR